MVNVDCMLEICAEKGLIHQKEVLANTSEHISELIQAEKVTDWQHAKTSKSGTTCVKLFVERQRTNICDE